MRLRMMELEQCPATMHLSEHDAYGRQKAALILSALARPKMNFGHSGDDCGRDGHYLARFRGCFILRLFDWPRSGNRGLSGNGGAGKAAIGAIFKE